MASANEAATRASVAAMLAGSAPERICVTMASNTGPGPGSSRGPSVSEPSSQSAKNATSERIRMTTPRSTPQSPGAGL